MKRNMFFLLILLRLLLFTGCFGGEEVGDRAFVQLLGLERQDGLYTAAMQIYKSESGGAEPDMSKANSISAKGTGSTVQSAIADAESTLGKKIFLGHIKLLVIGGGIENPSDELSLFLDGSLSPACPVAYSDDPAAVAETLIEEGSFSAEQIMSLMETASSQGKTVYTSVAELTSSTGVLDCAAALPVIKAEEKTVRFDGLTFARKNGTAGAMSEEDALGAKLLLDGFKRGDRITVPVTADGKRAAVFINGSSTCLNASMKEGRLNVTAKVKLNISVSENPYNADESAIEKAARETVRDACISAYSSAVWYNSCDIYGIKKLVRRDCPDFYGRYCADDEGYLGDSSFTVSVETGINS